jgi:Catalytic LigB subunit of aromatic ring-opening dioxygenase
MGEILGIGTTHHPGLTATDENFSKTWQTIINAPRIDPKWKDRRNWPAGMLDEVGNDMGLSAAKRYHERCWKNFRAQRKIIDDFKPDFIVIIADDQYENFRETIIPPFCVFGLDDDFEQEVWNHGFAKTRPNYWGEPHDWKLKIHGHRDGAKYLTAGLLNRGVSMPYAYKLLHSEILAHGFNYTVLYLDCDRKGFGHPVVPFHVNCYGSSVISAEGAFAHLFKEPPHVAIPDPPGPNPALCYEVGARMAETLAESPYRTVIMASSSWSHCFLSPKMGYVIPDHQDDRKMFAALKDGDYETWRGRTIEEVEAAGHHELLNWHVLAGAMGHLKRKPVILDYFETFIFQSDKCFCTFPAN